MNDSSNLTLRMAQKKGQLNEFIEQQEAKSIEPVTKAQFDMIVTLAVRAPTLQDQTSGSRAPGGSTGKKTRSRT